jgi:hypothetical protein
MANLYAHHRRLADRIMRYAEALGYDAKRSGSSLSASQYVEVAHEERDLVLKVRISDHVLPPSYGRGGDYEVGDHADAHGSWAGAVAWLAAKVEAPVPGPAKRILAAEQRARAEIEAMRARAREAAIAAAQEHEARKAALLARAAADPAFAADLRAAVASNSADRRNRRCDALADAVGSTRQAVREAGFALGRAEPAAA